MHMVFFLNFKIEDFFLFLWKKNSQPDEITSPKSPIFLYSFIDLARGCSIEILISFQRSNCSSFTSHGLGKHPGLKQFNRTREICSLKLVCSYQSQVLWLVAAHKINSGTLHHMSVKSSAPASAFDCRNRLWRKTMLRIFHVFFFP